MDTKKILAVALAIVILASAVGVAAWWYFSTKIESQPVIISEIIVNGRKIGGGEWKIPLEIFETGGQPLDRVQATVKLRWSLKYLGKEPYWKEVPVKFFAACFWQVEGYYSWWNVLKIPSTPQYDSKLTYIPYGMEYTLVDDALAFFGWLQGETKYWKDVLREYTTVAYTASGTAEAIDMFRSYVLRIRGVLTKNMMEAYHEALKKAMEHEGTVFKEPPETELAFGGTWNNLIESLATWLQEEFGQKLAPRNLRDGDEFVLYRMDKRGYEIQEDLKTIVFDYMIEYGVNHLRYHLWTDREGDVIKLSLWVFIWYQWQDLNGEWSDIRYAAKKLGTLTVRVVEGNWVQVSVETTSTGMFQGTWPFGG